MTNQDQSEWRKLSQVTITANGAKLEISELSYGEDIKQNRSLCKACVVGEPIPEGSDVVIEYEFEEGDTRRDILRNVRQVGKDQYTCLSIVWGEHSRGARHHDAE